MAKKYDNATEAAAKFITLPDDVMNDQKTTTEEQSKKRSGRTKKAEQNAPEAKEEAKPKKSTAKKLEANTEANTKPQRKSDGKAAFSVWLTKKTADEVKLYSAISGEKMTDLLEAALNEYMKNHKLTAKQKTEYRERKLRELDNI